MGNLILLLAAALMIGAAIYLGHQGLRLKKINRMLEAVVKHAIDNPPWTDKR